MFRRFRLTVKLQDMLLLAKTPVNVVISNTCVAKIKYFLKKCPRQLWNLEKIKDFLKYYSKKPLNRISLFIIFRVPSQNERCGEKIQFEVSSKT
jgi:hypothetical protein